MQLSRLVIVLIAAALPAIANAAQCSYENAEKPSDSVLADYMELSAVYLNLVMDMMNDITIDMDGRLQKRQDDRFVDYQMDCMLRHRAFPFRKLLTRLGS